MKPLTHLKLSTAAALLLAPKLKKGAVSFWVASLLIDLDHVPAMARNTGTWNPLHLARFALTFKYPPGSRPKGLRMGRLLHHPLALAPVTLLSLRLSWLAPVAMGFLFHRALDAIDYYREEALVKEAARRAGYRCQDCGRRVRRFQVHSGDGCPRSRPALDEALALCDQCHALRHVG